MGMSTLRFDMRVPGSAGSAADLYGAALYLKAAAAVVHD